MEKVDPSVLDLDSYDLLLRDYEKLMFMYKGAQRKNRNYRRSIRDLQRAYDGQLGINCRLANSTGRHRSWLRALLPW